MARDAYNANLRHAFKYFLSTGVVGAALSNAWWLARRSASHAAVSTGSNALRNYGKYGSIQAPSRRRSSSSSWTRKKYNAALQAALALSAAQAPQGRRRPYRKRSNNYMGRYKPRSNSYRRYRPRRRVHRRTRIHSKAASALSAKKQLRFSRKHRSRSRHHRKVYGRYCS